VGGGCPGLLKRIGTVRCESDSSYVVSQYWNNSGL